MSVQYKDYYKILGVSRTATEKEIKSAYRKLARKYHPDVNQTTGAAERFKEINEAYEVLGDQQKRKYYDQLGSGWRHGANFNRPPGQESVNINLDDLGSVFGEYGFAGGPNGGFSDFFEMLFGQMQGMPPGMQPGMGGGARARARAAGPYTQAQANAYSAGPTPSRSGSAAQTLNVEQELLLELEEVAKGASKSVQLTHSGKRVTVDIPKGVQPGQKVRLSGEGKKGPGGQNGDVFLIVKYAKHPHFEPDGLNLYYDFHLYPQDLVLGVEVTIITLYGKVALKIPTMTKPDRLMRLKGQGLPDKEGKEIGDLLVRTKVKLPDPPSEKEVALFKQLRQLALAKN
ncbi:MAG: DnaJ domain-containing protein [Vampirovibrio sp.]|nr:DnaJ domain-containing protein [Vampirovibrio sp.]